MKPIDVIGSQPGRVLRVVADGALIGWGLRRGDSPGRAAAAAGVVPLAAGAADVCLLGPSGAVHAGSTVQRGLRPFLPIAEYPWEERRDKRPPTAELTVLGSVQNAASLLMERRTLR